MIARMNGKAADIGVVEIEVAKRRTIGERGKVRRSAPIGPDNNRVADDGKRDVAADANRPFVERADAATDGIDDMRLHPFDSGGVEIFETQPMRVIGKLFGE